MKPDTISYAESWMPAPMRFTIHVLETTMGRGQLIKRYRRFQEKAKGKSGVDIWSLAMEGLGIHSQSTANLQLPVRRPGRGLLLVANHPFGIADGITLAWIASRMDSEFYVIAHGALRQEPSLNSNILAVDFQPGREAIKANVEMRRRAVERLQAGGVVAVFPAGAVSWSQRRGEPVSEEIWKPLTGRLVKAGQVDVLPIRFYGHNSRLFQIASRIADPLRQGLFMYEVRRMLDTPIQLEMRGLIPFEDIPEMSDQDLALWLQKMVMEDTSVKSRVIMQAVTTPS